jgi:hypothetical protein
MLSINKHGIRKIKRSVPNIINHVLQNLNIKSLISCHHRSTTGQKEMRSSHLSQPSAKLCQTIVSNFCGDPSPDMFEEAGCGVCGKLTPTYEMEELSAVDNISIFKVDGVTRKA